MAKKKSSNAPELADILANELNKYSKSNKVAYFLDEHDSPTEIKSWVSFGNDVLDLAVSNRPNAGAPVGRIIEVTGLEQSGKSLLSAHLLASTQKQGGVAVMIDTENAVSIEFLNAIGVITSGKNKLLYAQADSVEQVFEFIETIISKVREGDRDKLVTIVVDSVAAASTKVELAADYDQAGYATQKAIIISKALRKITNMIGRQKILLSFTNQLRVNLSAMAFGDPYTTSGGKALQFHASVRLRLKPKGQIKDKSGRIVGMKVQCIVVKNRLGPPKRSMEFDIFFNRGIDNYGSWLKVLKEAKIIKTAGSYSKVVNESTGEEHQFYAKDFAGLLETSSGLKDQLYDALCKEMVMEYEMDTSDPDALTVVDTEEVDPEESK